MVPENCSRCGGAGQVYDARTASTTPITCPICRGAGFSITIPVETAARSYYPPTPALVERLRWVSDRVRGKQTEVAALAGISALLTEAADYIERTEQFNRITAGLAEKQAARIERLEAVVGAARRILPTAEIDTRGGMGMLDDAEEELTEALEALDRG